MNTYIVSINATVAIKANDRNHAIEKIKDMIDDGMVCADDFEFESAESLVEASEQAKKRAKEL